MTTVIEMKRITKTFPGVVANEAVDLEIRQGEIHALLGENGAGKTTLMNILYGLYEPDEGEIWLKGKKVHIPNPNVAISLGIGMVHQHFMLVPPFTVAENIILGSETRRMGVFLDQKKAIEEVAKLSERYGLKVDPTAKVESISVGQQQRVEILKALYRGAEVLILDEPTAVLTPQEVLELAAIMRRLVEQGRTIIFITHKLKEVMRVSDRVTVIRRGKVVSTLNTKDTNEEQLATMMVGREVMLRVEKGASRPGLPVLQVTELKALNNRRLPALKGVSFDVRAGEIVGIAGVDGNGQTELVESLTGLRRATGGKVAISGKDMTNRPPGEMIQNGIGHIPEDRQKRGLILPFSVAENMILGNHSASPYARRWAMNYASVTDLARKLIDQFDIRTPDEQTLAAKLSGGNQQKVIVAREIDREPKVLIAAQPTRGLDVGAIEFIHRRIIQERDRGKAVLLVSLELDEILALSDRILVIFEGQIVAEMQVGEATEERLGLLMAGGESRKSGSALKIESAPAKASTGGDD